MRTNDGSTMMAILRAFAWLRWRMLINSFERTGSRDAVERFSLATEKLGPIVAGILLVPSAVVLGVGGVFAGYALGATGGPTTAFEIVRFALLAILVFSILGPIVLPSADRTNPVRMLLLPISRQTLYVGQAAGALADPWVLLVIPVLAGVVLGLAAAGALATALMALAAGTAFAAILAGLATLSTSVMHLVARDRRRGEALALILVIIIPVMAFVPTMIAGDRSTREERRRTPLVDRIPAWVGPVVETGFALVPSELYSQVARQTARQHYASAAMPLGGLALAALLLNIVGFAVYSRLLDTPASAASRRTGAMNERWTRSLPGLSPAASAVALGHFRLALRTPRGRSIMLTPVLMFSIIGAAMWYQGGAMRFGPFAFGSGLTLATFGAAMSMLSILPMIVNQYAIDRAGLTLILLSPVSEREYLAGKAVGNGLVAGLPALVVIVVAMVLFPTGSPALWVGLLLGLLGTYVAAAPVAAILSAVFPRAVDMNAIGRGSNAHSAAGIIGMFAFAAAASPPFVLAFIAVRWLERPALTPVFLLAWALIAVGLNRILSSVAERIFRARRENLSILIG
ncbi:hypothetical protein BH23ACI1_BH23ACI1_12080 [soil metagenome]